VRVKAQFVPRRLTTARWDQPEEEADCRLRHSRGRRERECHDKSIVSRTGPVNYCRPSSAHRSSFLCISLYRREIRAAAEQGSIGRGELDVAEMLVMVPPSDSISVLIGKFFKSWACHAMSRALASVLVIVILFFTQGCVYFFFAEFGDFDLRELSGSGTSVGRGPSHSRPSTPG